MPWPGDGPAGGVYYGLPFTTSDRIPDVISRVARHTGWPSCRIYNCPCHLIKPPVKLLHVFLQIPVFAGEIVAIQINQQIFNQTKQEKKYVYMEVSWNGGTPKSSILIGFSILHHPFWGIYTTISGNPHNIYIYYINGQIMTNTCAKAGNYKRKNAEKNQPIIRSAWLFVSGTCAYKALTKSM